MEKENVREGEAEESRRRMVGRRMEGGKRRIKILFFLFILKL